MTIESKITKLQKQNIDDRYNKYVKNAHRVEKFNNQPVISTSSINQMMSVKGESRLMLSPIPEKRWED